MFSTPAGEEKAEIDLTDSQVERILAAAKSTNYRDYLFLCLIGAGEEAKTGRGLRIGEVVGVRKVTRYQAWKDKHNHQLGKEWRTSETDLPGIYKGDLREDEGTLWLRRKGGKVVKIQMPDYLFKELQLYSRGFGPTQKLFDFEERWGYDLAQRYARMTGMPDWDKVHPHRFRHYFITRSYEMLGGDLKSTQTLAGHATWRTTLRYVHKLTPEKEKQKLESLNRPRDSSVVHTTDSDEPAPGEETHTTDTSA